MNQNYGIYKVLNYGGDLDPVLIHSEIGKFLVVHSFDIRADNLESLQGCRFVKLVDKEITLTFKS